MKDHSVRTALKVIEPALEAALALFAPNHALDRMDWGRRALRAQDIRELSELPGILREALTIVQTWRTSYESPAARP